MINGVKGNSGFIAMNNVPYDRPPFDDEYADYCKTVKKITDKTVRKLKDAGLIPLYCKYSGIMFAESEQECVNPNDWRKRSVDHIKPIVSCFFDGDAAEFAGSEDNITFVLKYINTVKGNSSLESCSRTIQNIKERFINAGYSVEIV